LPTSTAYRLLDTELRGAYERDRARAMDPAQLIALIEASGLRGRGGAGFPLARKLATARAAAAGGSAFIVANAYDADPGSPLSRTLLLRRPELVIEGLAIAAAAIGATRAFLYLHPEAAAARRAAERALEERRAGLGDLRVEIALGPGGFIGGEESALLAVLESRRAMARQRPPYPGSRACSCVRPSSRAGRRSPRCRSSFATARTRSGGPGRAPHPARSSFP